MLNVVIPMAGRGSRLAKAGYKKPKPFIEIEGKTMIERVLDSLKTDQDVRYILIMQAAHIQSEKDSIERLKNNYNTVFLTVPEITEGAAHTVMTARQLIDNKDRLVIVNSDNIIDTELDNIINDADEANCNGSIVCFTANDTKWSYCGLDNNGLVNKVVEKQVISDKATAGIYYFEHGENFVSACITMFIKNDRVNNEFYVAPTYNYYIKEGGKIKTYMIDYSQFHDIGTPENLIAYENLLRSRV